MKTTLTKVEMIAELTRVRELIETLTENNALQVESKAGLLREIDYFLDSRRKVSEIRTYFNYFRKNNEQLEPWKVS